VVPLVEVEVWLDELLVELEWPPVLVDVECDPLDPVVPMLLLL
jgi:hypothetical protein